MIQSGRDRSATIGGRRGRSQLCPRKRIADSYHVLRAAAHALMRHEDRGHMLPPSAVVHEVFIRLADREAPPAPADLNEFLRIAVGEMKRVLVDHARASQARKRRAEGTRLGLKQAIADVAPSPVVSAALNEALADLRNHDPVMFSIVLMRVLGGMTHQEIALALDIPLRTEYRKWALARSRLYQALTDDDRSDDPAMGE